MGTRVLVVDDHALSSEGLLKTLSNAGGEIEVVGVFLQGAEALEQAASLCPDVILFNDEMTEVDAAAFAAEVQARGLEARVVVYNALDDLGIAKNLLAVGVSGYVLKSAPCAQILEAMRAVCEGKAWLSPTLGAQAAQQWTEDLPDLNERQQAVLAFLAQGLENKEMAAQLALAESTVKHKVSELYRLLGATNRGQLALRAGELVLKFSRRKGEGGNVDEIVSCL